MHLAEWQQYPISKNVHLVRDISRRPVNLRTDGKSLGEARAPLGGPGACSPGNF